MSKNTRTLVKNTCDAGAIRSHGHFVFQFPLLDGVDMKVYRESRSEVNVSVRVRQKLNSQSDVHDPGYAGFQNLSKRVTEFFVTHGATGRIWVQPEFYLEVSQGIIDTVMPWGNTRIFCRG